MYVNTLLLVAVTGPHQGDIALEVSENSIQPGPSAPLGCLHGNAGKRIVLGDGQPSILKADIVLFGGLLLVGGAATQFRSRPDPRAWPSILIRENTTSLSLKGWVSLFLPI